MKQLQNQWINPEDIHEREMKILIRNEKRHQELILYLLNLLRSKSFDIPDKSIKDYIDNMDKYDSMWIDYQKEE